MNGIAPYPYFCRASETLVALGVMGTTFAELGGATRLVLIRWSLIFQVVEWFVFNIQSHASQEYRSWSVPSSMPDAKRYARMAFSAANQSISGDQSGLPLFFQCWYASFCTSS